MIYLFLLFLLLNSCSLFVSNKTANTYDKNNPANLSYNTYYYSEVGSSIEGKQVSYYKFTIDYRIKTIPSLYISSVDPSHADLDIYLYSESTFSNLVGSNTGSGTPSSWKLPVLTTQYEFIKFYYFLIISNKTDNISNVTFIINWH